MLLISAAVNLDRRLGGPAPERASATGWARTSTMPVATAQPYAQMLDRALAEGARMAAQEHRAVD